jgi:hypothetical protein
MNESGMSRTDEPGLGLFDTILRVNARERGLFQLHNDFSLKPARTDWDKNENALKTHFFAVFGFSMKFHQILN